MRAFLKLKNIDFARQIAKSFCCGIDEQPTAYDVNKVVKQLEERSKEFNSGLRLHGKPENMRTEEAIEIVKAGGL